MTARTEEKIVVKILTNATDTEYATMICPKCKVRGVIDKEQYEGKISILCECGFHKTINCRK